MSKWRNSTLALLALVCSLAITLPARADVITWTLTDVPLSDGTDLSGTITTDTMGDLSDLISPLRAVRYPATVILPLLQILPFLARLR